MKNAVAFTAVVAALILTACGGGGGSSTPAGQNNNQTQTQPSTIVTTANPANYGAGTQQRNAFDYLQGQRSTCGFGLLEQSAQLDTAAQAHTDYLTLHNLVRTHLEDQVNFPAGFTGTTPVARMAAAGYALAFGAGSEVIGEAQVSNYGTTIGQAATMNLLSLPLHGFGMLQGDRDVGVGYTNANTELIYNFAFSNARPKQLLASNEVRTYPCNGVSGVLSQSYYDEAPAPIPGRNLATQPIGHPIYLKARDGQTLTITTSDLRVQGGGAPVATQLLNRGSDASNTIPDNSIAIVMPLAPLATNTTYAFTAAGTNAGEAFNVSFTFTTGGF